ncbi:MAG: hypothetical protein K6B13_02265, partial [Prevotella sp.]|nr:hypothetical protein [Prevotella sp.]
DARQPFHVSLSMCAKHVDYKNAEFSEILYEQALKTKQNKKKRFVRQKIRTVRMALDIVTPVTM